MNIPECPRNWDSLWIGYSFAMVRTNCLQKYPHNLNTSDTSIVCGDCNSFHVLQ